MITERNDPVELPNRNPKGINPALLTFDEYYKMANEKDRWHSSSAYDTTLKQLNGYLPKSEYDRLYRRIKIHGLNLEIWLYKGKHGATENGVINHPDEWGIGVFNGDTRVAAVQDEWGCLLVMVAQEYRGFGLGPMLVKMARTIQPDRPSGGFTQGGYQNFVKVYQSMVRDALASGLYQSLIKRGEMTVGRAKEIIASARLEPRKPKVEKNLSSDDPKSWMLYVGEYGDFVVYDRKLKDLLDEDRDYGDYFTDQMMKGFAYVQLHDGHNENWAMLRQFGADSPAIKRLLINCAVQYSNDNGTTLYLEPDEIDFIDKRMIAKVEDVGVARGFKSYKVVPTGEVFDYKPFGLVERRWRKRFDRYDEFFNRMIELAHSKYRYQPEETSKRGR